MCTQIGSTNTLEFLSDKLSLEELGEGIAFSIDVNAGHAYLGRLWEQ